MIVSMTGFGESNIELNGINYKIELKALNSKNLEFNFRSPSLFRNLEINIKNLLQKKLIRGKVDLSINAETNLKTGLDIDEDVFIEQYNNLKHLATKVGSSEDVFSLALSKSMTKVEINNLSELEINIVLNTLDDMLDKVHQYRSIEGQSIDADIVLWISVIKEQLSQIIDIEQNRIQAKRDKLNKALSELNEKFSLDPNKMEQELIYYIEKFDISEEISRLTQHIKLFLDTKDEEEANGKKLQFISQEIGREINTIGSKSNDFDMQRIVVIMKDHLEKIKEQLGNVL